jgi:hypothetical protein
MKSNKPAVKGIMFGGCSFTWGQGLYYYSNLPTLKEPMPDCFDSTLVTSAHLRFMESVRYPRIVANYFNTWEIVNHNNGGSNLSIINHSNQLLTHHPKRNHPDYYTEEISHFVFQLTQHHRDNFFMSVEGNTRHIPFHETSNEPIKSEFLLWLQQHNLTLDEWIVKYVQENVSRVEEFLRQIESKGIKTIVMCWPSDPQEYVDCVFNNDFIKKRLITFTYKNTDYKTIQDMMKKNKELEIKFDYENFIETPKDHHPSLLCHQVMAEHVIKAIKNGNDSV